jgi:hypothetical protein
MFFTDNNFFESFIKIPPKIKKTEVYNSRAIKGYIIFSHPDFTVGTGITPVQR